MTGDKEYTYPVDCIIVKTQDLRKGDKILACRFNPPMTQEWHMWRSFVMAEDPLFIGGSFSVYDQDPHWELYFELRLGDPPHLGSGRYREDLEFKVFRPVQ